MQEEMIELGIYDVQYDDENPRIKGALEKYGKNISAERIHFALQNSSEEQTSSSFHHLKMSIKAINGISERIKVAERDGKHVCIDGNTRLAIYRDFAKRDEHGSWDKIPCLVLRDVSQLDIEKIRVTAHLLGSRPWPAYEKAKYLDYLRFKKYMDYDELIALCGGSRTDIERQIRAFEDMNEYYRDKVDDADFKIDRFSGFVELQKQGIKEAIFQAGFTLEDFGNWIHRGNIKALADVRRLPKVLRDSEARKVLDTGGINSIKDAERLVDEKNRTFSDATEKIVDAGMETLAYELNKKLASLTLDELNNLKEDETLSIFEELYERLSEVLNYVGK